MSDSKHTPEPLEFLIQDTRPNDVYPGLCVWWGPDRNGYTTDLGKAGLYTERDARDQERRRETDMAVPVSVARSLAMTVVDTGRLDAAIAKTREEA